MAVAVTGDARKRRALYGVMLSVFLAAMESTVVATAMPTVVASLGGVHIYSWVFSGFLLTSTVTMPLWGRVSDLFGRRPVYLGGLGIFLLGDAPPERHRDRRGEQRSEEHTSELQSRHYLVPRPLLEK